MRGQAGWRVTARRHEGCVPCRRLGGARRQLPGGLNSPQTEGWLGVAGCRGVRCLTPTGAFLAAAGAAGIETRIFHSDFTVQGGPFGCSRVLGGFPAVAVMAANGLMAIGALHYAYDRRISVPAELSVIGFDNIDFAQFTQPALTTVAVP